MDIIIPSAIIGLISSVITEVLGIVFFKKLGYGLQKLTAFLIVLILIILYLVSVQTQYAFNGMLGLFITSLIVSYGIWKTIFKPVELAFNKYQARRLEGVKIKKEEDGKIKDDLENKDSI